MSGATIYEVARLAGVSIKTVSRVMNGEQKVSAETRRRVIAAVKDLDYRPNVLARALAGSRSYLVGLYFDNPSLEYVSRVERGAMAACRQAGFHLVVEELRGSGPSVAERVRQLQAAIAMDGVVLTPPLCDRADLLEALEAGGVPYVRIAPALHLERGDYIYLDDRRAAQEMTAYLQALGHRRIAFIAGPADHLAAVQRRDGYLDAMRAAGLLDHVRLAEGAFTFRSGLIAAAKLLETERPTAIFAANDDMALGVIMAAHQLHISVPAELSVVGFDDSPSAQVVWPQLTTVRQPVTEMGQAAVELLIGPRADPAAKPMARRLDFAIIERESSGPAS